MSATPITAPNNRIAILDCWRGFAIFGILLVNIMTFSAPNHDFEQMAFNSTLWYDTLASKISSLFLKVSFILFFHFYLALVFWCK